MGLFSDIYNTVAKFFRPQEEQGEVSKSVATNRLKLVLMQDRTNLTPRVLEQMRGELIDLLSKYVELDKELLELNFEQEGEQVALMLSIPVIRAKDEDEIEAVLNQANDEDKISEDDAEENSEQETDENVEQGVEASEEVVAENDENEDKNQNISAPEEVASHNKKDEVEKEENEECNTEK